jgi:hypothetical protein
MSYDVVNDVAVTDADRIAAREDMANLTRWRSEKIVHNLLENMLPDVLANTLVVWSAEMSEGGTHSNRNIPLVMVQGSDYGAFRAGRYIKFGDWNPLERYNAEYGGRPMNQVLVSLCRSMGLDDVSAVGDPSIPSGPLEELL